MSSRRLDKDLTFVTTDAQIVSSLMNLESLCTCGILVKGRSGFGNKAKRRIADSCALVCVCIVCMLKPGQKFRAVTVGFVRKIIRFGFACQLEVATATHNERWRTDTVATATDTTTATAAMETLNTLSPRRNPSPASRGPGACVKRQETCAI